MSSLFALSELYDLIEKVEKNERLSFSDGLRMMESNDILAIGHMANLLRERKNDNETCFLVNRKFGYSEDLDSSLIEIERVTREVLRDEVTAIDLIRQTDSNLSLDYYLKLLQSVKGMMPDITIKALNVSELDRLVEETGLALSGLLQQLKKAGLDSLLEDGVEIFSSSEQTGLNNKGISLQRFLETHENAHQIGMSTGAGMFYDHSESKESFINYLFQLRELQGKTGGFFAFIPCPVCPVDKPLDHNMGVDSTTGFDDIKMLAISRIILDNFDHIKALWNMLGPKLAQVSLAFGADAFETANRAMSKRTLINMIRKAGRDAVERDALYRVLKTN